MSNTLIPLSELGVKELEPTSISALTRTSDFLPQVRVYGASNDVVKENKFPMGHFGLYTSKDNIVDLGEQFDCLVISSRPRAGTVTGDSPISFYNMDSEEFKDMQRRAMNKEQGYMVGLEYLLWIAKIEKFALFWMGNPTLRRESEKVKASVGNAATLKIKFIKTSTYSWHGAECLLCETEFAVPDLEEIKTEVEKFNNPTESDVKLSEEDTRKR